MVCQWVIQVVNGEVVVVHWHVFVLVFVPVRGTGSIRNPSSALPTLGKVLVMANLATNSNKIRIILMVLSRGWRVAWPLLPAHGRQATLKIELQVKAFSNAFNSVHAVAYNVYLSTEGFNSGIRVTELLGDSEYLRILE